MNIKNEEKLEKLIYILDLPKTYTNDIIEIAIYLSMFGWQGYSVRGKGYIQCLFCRRLVGLWNFKSHNHTHKAIKENTEKGKKNFFERPWHNMNLKRLNEILSKRKASEKIENAKKRRKVNDTENSETTNNDDESKTENSITLENDDESKAITENTSTLDKDDELKSENITIINGDESKIDNSTSIEDNNKSNTKDTSTSKYKDDNSENENSISVNKDNINHLSNDDSVSIKKKNFFFLKY